VLQLCDAVLVLQYDISANGVSGTNCYVGALRAMRDQSRYLIVIFEER
jgi:hypothetical protein